MKELVVLSGKGGAGKTSIVAALASCARGAVFADCDVDAADLHLLLVPEVEEKSEFHAGSLPFIDSTLCTSCGKCKEVCSFNAIGVDFTIDTIACEGCGLCAYFCPVNAVEMKVKRSGELFVSSTRFGPMVHAQLGTAEDNSGKLVTTVRKRAQALAVKRNASYLLTDAPPGIACPVIASITGATCALLVCEATVSGLHDIKRSIALLEHFNIPAVACINKFDLNEECTGELEQVCMNHGIDVLAHIPYDEGFTKAQREGKSLIEHTKGLVAGLLTSMWEKIENEYL